MNERTSVSAYRLLSCQCESVSVPADHPVVLFISNTQVRIKVLYSIGYCFLNNVHSVLAHPVRSVGDGVPGNYTLRDILVIPIIPGIAGDEHLVLVLGTPPLRRLR